MALDLWATARKQIADYEQRSAELSLSLTAEKVALESVEKEAQKVAAETAELNAKAKVAESRKVTGHQQVEGLSAAKRRAAKDNGVLQQHLELLQAERESASKQMEADRCRYAEHLTQLKERMAAYEECIAEA